MSNVRIHNVRVYQGGTKEQREAREAAINGYVHADDLVVGEEYQVCPADEHYPHRVGVYKEVVENTTLVRMIDTDLSEKTGVEATFLVRRGRLMKV